MAKPDPVLIVIAVATACVCIATFVIAFPTWGRSTHYEALPRQDWTSLQPPPHPIVFPPDGWQVGPENMPEKFTPFVMRAGESVRVEVGI